MMQSYFEQRRPFTPNLGTIKDLCQDSDQLKLVDSDLRHFLDDPVVIKAIESDNYPVPSTQEREGYHDNRHVAYWLSGYNDLVSMERAGVTERQFNNVLDLGGASGRVSRHIVNRYKAATVDIAELNINHVEWVDVNFDRRIRAVKIGPYPQLPFPDNTYTFCCAFSLFTHVDAYETTLLAEINRVLKPEALAFITIHTEHTWALLPDAYIYNALKNHPEFSTIFKPGQRMPFDHKVFEYNPGSIEYHCNTFVSTDYINRRWSKWFEIISIIPHAHGYQTGVLLKKRS